MFKQARLKLTVWYLFIIMLISIFFSVLVYRSISLELERGYHRAAIEERAGELNINLPRQLPFKFENIDPRLQNLAIRQLLIEDLQAAKKRVKNNLFLLNGVILAISTAAGYILAGKTLEPIRHTLIKQKRFIADASHELRTPITALKTSLEVNLRDRNLTAKTKNILQSNLDDVNGLERLTNNLLKLSHSPKQKLYFKKIKTDEFVRRALKKIKPQAEKKKIKLVNQTKNTAGTMVQGNPEALTELVTILLDNAVKYTPEGGRIALTTKVNKKNLILTIADNGIGIDKKDLPYIFDRFYRADTSRSKVKVSGFGLGLSVAKKIVVQHKASISVKSKINKGATFIIKLPA